MNALKKKKICLIFLFVGIPILAMSIYFESTSLALIGLTLIFWSSLFFVVLNDAYIKKELTNLMLSSSLTTIKEMVNYFNYKEKGIYIPIQRESYLITFLDIKNEFIYLTKTELSYEKIIEEAIMKNPPGLRIIPPGLSIANYVDKKLNYILNSFSINDISEHIFPILINDLEIAEKIEIKIEDKNIAVTLTSSICNETCIELTNDSLMQSIGCPICSSIACILLRVVNKPLSIVSCQTEKNSVKIGYHIF